MWRCGLRGWGKEIFCCLKGYWWFHWGPQGPSLWLSDSSSVHWYSNPAHRDSPEATETGFVHSPYKHSTQPPCEQIFIPTTQFSREAMCFFHKFMSRNWRCGWWFRGLKPGYRHCIQSPNVRCMLSELVYIQDLSHGRKEWTEWEHLIQLDNDRKCAKYRFKEADAIPTKWLKICWHCTPLYYRNAVFLTAYRWVMHPLKLIHTCIKNINVGL